MGDSHDVVIAGAGQAGLSLSHALTRDGREHVILERGKLGQSWRTRWDSFCLVVGGQKSDEAVQIDFCPPQRGTRLKRARDSCRPSVNARGYRALPSRRARDRRHLLLRMSGEPPNNVALPWVQPHSYRRGAIRLSGIELARRSGVLGQTPEFS
jgi:choline dehydrogenase-like flavoprotein